jgi:hypothetical protein
MAEMRVPRHNESPGQLAGQTVVYVGSVEEQNQLLGLPTPHFIGSAHHQPRALVQTPICEQCIPVHRAYLKVADLVCNLGRGIVT